jgi:ribosomal protein S18 acetylase RimI-like enzyme
MIKTVTPHDDAQLSAAARLMHDFNTEYDEPSPGPDALTGILARRIADGHATVLLACDDGGEPVGIAIARLSPSLWSDALEAYLAELYVVPQRRGQGFGRELLAAFLESARDAGADYAFLVTSEDDVSAQRAYEAAGFRRTEGEGGPLMLAYEQDL